MLSKLSLFCLVVLSAAAPLSSDRDQLIRKVWGEDVNTTLAESIIADEAKRFGVSTDEYFNTCTAEANSFELTPEEKVAMEQEKSTLEKTDDLKIENKDQLLNEIKTRAPKTYAIVKKRLDILDTYVAKLNPEAQKFAKDVGNAIVEVFVSIAKAQKKPDEGVQQLMRIGAAAKKIYAEYKALPQSAKDSLDKTFCINATIRIVKSQIEQFFVSMVSKVSSFETVSSAAPLTVRDQLIRKVWGEDVNTTLAESIIADEAKRFGVSTDEYFNTCTADADSFELTPEEKTAIEQEKSTLEQSDDLKIENKDQLLNEIKTRASKTYAIVKKRLDILDTYVAKLNPEAQKFAMDVGNAIVEAFVSIAKAQKKPDNIGMEQLMNIGAAAKKIYAEYQSLSQSAKDSLDKTFCINATIRIVKSQIEQFFATMVSKYLISI